MERAGIQLQNIIPDNQQPLGTLIKKELEHKIQEVIQKLPPVCKQVFMMSRFREMSYEEISQELDISVNTVKYHIKNALVVLKKEFGTFFMHFSRFLPYPLILKNCSIYKGNHYLWMNNHYIQTQSTIGLPDI